MHMPLILMPTKKLMEEEAQKILSELPEDEAPLVEEQRRQGYTDIQIAAFYDALP